MSNDDSSNRRGHTRVKVRVPVQIKTESSTSPMRGATADLSLNGCYIESIFPFPVGTKLDLQLSIDAIVPVAATVATRDPQVGNGIKFVSMLPEDKETLAAFLEAAQQAHDAEASGSSDGFERDPALL